MKFKFILGCDVSKNWLNFSLMDGQFEVLGQWQIDNTVKDITSFLSDLLDQQSVQDINQVCLVMEYTGVYVQHLVQSALAKNLPTSLVAAQKISEHLAGKVNFEDKTDPIDACRIAEYGHRFQDKLVMYQPTEDKILLIKRLQKQRERLIKAINILEVPVKESKLFDPKNTIEQVEQNQLSSITALKQDLKTVEKQLEQILKQDPYLNKLMKRMMSVEGVGKVIATTFLLLTEGFTKFKPEQAKAFSRYAGTAPLPRQSGIKNRKRRTPKRKQKGLKTNLTMGAISLIRTDSELGKFYWRKIAEGKHHLSVINAMRNKIILRVFAVIKNDTMYQKNLNICLEKP